MGEKQSNLLRAKINKNDEFYTRFEDIEKELQNYKEHFKDKVVYCNCDNAQWSNFFFYFKENFKSLGLRRLIATHYTNDLNEQRASLVEVFKDQGTLTISKSFLDGNGDFRSQECVALLQQADIVCTNPPFSLFREFIQQLIEHKKQFLIIGNFNSVNYKNVFSHIKDGNIWFGINKVTRFIENGNTEREFGNICWFTNLTNKKRTQDLVLSKAFNSSFQKYDNYDAIEISKVSNIPFDYFDLMGVPITFLDKYNPNQFEIIGLFSSKTDDNPVFIKGSQVYINDKLRKYVGPVLNGQMTYTRIIIKRINK